MCGIAGTFGSSNPDPSEWLPLLRHRGPDGEGVWRSPSGLAALAHTRLAILDLSDAGAQPMSSDNERYHIAFNGEIYNFSELKRSREEKGYVFRGNSDTEVLLALLEELPVKEAVQNLAGMFAFAFWDEKNERGVLARDPFGIKPLYYCVSPDGALHFASEVKALRKLVATDNPINREAKQEFLKWGSVPEPLTLLEGVRSLPAGAFIEWEKGSLSIHSFRSLQFPVVKNSEVDYVKQTRTALEESVQRHLVSDVPVGLFLSGGIDSTVMLALTRQMLGAEADIRTFSIGFDNPDYDESSVARKTAEHFGANHTEWIMTSEEGKGEIPGYLEHMDQPTIDGFNTWCVSKLARRNGAKVVLSGLGGDELFAGYSSFVNLPKFRKWYRNLGRLRSSVAFAMGIASEGSKWGRLSSFLKSDGNWLDAFHAQRGIFTGEEAELLVSCFEKNGSCSNPEFYETGDALDSVSLLELTRYMRNQLLRDSDVFSMAHGLELRVPFVDFRLFEAISAIPSSVRLRQGKQLLLEAVPEVPAWVRERPKNGFRFPFDDWVTEVLGERLEMMEARSSVELGSWFRKWALVSLQNVTGE